MSKANLRLSAYTLASAIGTGVAATLASLRAQRGGVRRQYWETIPHEMCLAEVLGLDNVNLRSDLHEFDCRNNRLAQLGLMQDDFEQTVRQTIERYGRQRVGVFLGTSTSGILSSEIAYRHRDTQTGKLPVTHDYRHTHNSYSIADFVRHYFGLTGPAHVVSTACSSSAKVFASAKRMLDCGLIDAAIVGGVDSFCLTTLYGFNALQLISLNPCRPYDGERDGISMGEAAAFALLEKVEDLQAGEIVVAGIGESSDAHHMSSPHPEGLGAKMAMQHALKMANLQPSDIDYINLHGTATPSNDAAEDKAVTALFGTHVPCSSTKGHTGHTLGAAGGIEALFCALALQHNTIWGGVETQTQDAQLHCNYQLHNQVRPLRHVLSNSFGFGGSNCSLILSKVN